MKGYGTHPTQYGWLSNESLYSMYRECIYSQLSESQKLDLLQETVNRDALERGEIGSPEVRFAVLPANTSGNAANGVISVNRDMAVNGIQTFEYQGQTIQHPIADYNLQALNTVIHENVHCFQNQVIDGTILINNPQLTAEYQANDFTFTAVLQNHGYSLGSQYLTGETPGGYYMYYFQATERDAFLFAEKKTDAIMKGLSEKYGMEPSFAAYAKSIAATGYQVREQEAIQLFQNPNFVRDLNQTLQNQYFGTNKPVDPATERAVKAEMVDTMKAMQQISKESPSDVKETANMSLEFKPVTLEEYNQSLRNSVNAYYTHAMNDPSMSKEEALQSTGAMAEKYLEAVEEFQEAQNHTAQNTVSAEVNGDVTQENTIDNVVDNVEGSSAEAAAAEPGDPSVDGEGPSDGCDNDMDP